MKTQDSLIGQHFGKLTVTAAAESDKHGKRRWLCTCDCGKECTVLGTNLRSGHTTSCGCAKENDLTGKHIGTLTVLERSDQYSTRGKRKRRLWKCLCDCGEITYKATDILTNPALSMCSRCAEKYASDKMRDAAGYVDGTQISRIKSEKLSVSNTSGARGVYYDKRTGKWRARLKFKGKLMNFGSYYSFDEAVKARARAEEEYYGEFLAAID
ncbi:MAG: hypothetical protein IJA67_03975 [Oscillospiraceae bacterium]|nr:hypothetical protein [Oscillospiraceae bacterium]